MRPKDFYAFCRDHRATEEDLHKEQALRATYNHMTEHGCSKEIIRDFIGRQFVGMMVSQEMIEAYGWLIGILEGTVPSDDSIELVPVQGSEAEP